VATARIKICAYNSLRLDTATESLAAAVTNYNVSVQCSDTPPRCRPKTTAAVCNKSKQY